MIADQREKAADACAIGNEDVLRHALPHAVDCAGASRSPMTLDEVPLPVLVRQLDQWKLVEAAENTLLHFGRSE
jgi:hypothetical protein